MIQKCKMRHRSSEFSGRWMHGLCQPLLKTNLASMQNPIMLGVRPGVRGSTFSNTHTSSRSELRCNFAH